MTQELLITERATGLLVANFLHHGEEFSVLKQGQERVTLNVVYDEDIIYGVIRGIWRESTLGIDFDIHWIGRRDAPIRVPYLLGTALGEVAAQSRDRLGRPLTFRTPDWSTTDPFNRILGYLQKDPRFLDRIKVGLSPNFLGSDYVVFPK